MQRVLVIGCSGAGKSTLGRRIAKALGLPLIELDCLFWRPGWVETAMHEFRDVIAPIVATPAWVMVGTYSATFDQRMPRADTIVWLDFARRVCLFGVLTRIARDYGRVREGMPVGCPQHIDLAFLRYVWTFNTVHRPRIVAALAKYAGSARLHRLESHKDSERFMAMIEQR